MQGQLFFNIVMFLAHLVVTAAIPLLPEVKAEFGLSVRQTGLILSSYGLGRLVLDVPASYLVTGGSAKKLLACGASALCLGSIMTGLAPDFAGIVLSRFLVGLGSAMIVMTTLASLSRLSHASRRGRTFARYQTSVVGAAILGPAIAGKVAGMAGWRFAFFVSAAIGLLLLYIVVVTQQKAGGEEAIGFNSIVDQEQEVTQAVDSERLWRWLPRFVLINFASFLLFLNVSGLLGTVVPVYCRNVLRLDLETIGLVLGAGALTRLVAGLLGGELSDRYGQRLVLGPGLALMGTCTFLLSWARSPLSFIVTLVALPIGHFGNAVPTSMILDHTPAARWAIAVGVNRLVGDIAIVSSPVLLGWLTDVCGFDCVFWGVAALLWLASLAVIGGTRQDQG